MPPDTAQTLTNQIIGDAEPERLLLVDDEEIVRLALLRYLSTRGYIVDAASNAAEALTHLERERYTLMLCDVRMPGQSGLDLLPTVRSIDPDLAVVMLSAVSDVPSAAAALERGAMDYLTKPLNLEDLGAALDRAKRRRRLAMEHRNVEHLLQTESARLTRLHMHDMELLSDGAVHALVRIVELREAQDHDRRGMSRRMATVAEGIATAIGLPPGRVWQIRSAAQLADLGRLVEPAAFAGRDTNVARALDILSGLTSLADLVEAVRDQDERWDGSGTPRGLARDAISLGGRVLSATRAFTELTAALGGVPSLSADDAVNVLDADAGRRLDPGVYQALATLIRERRLLGFGADLVVRPPRLG